MTSSLIGKRIRLIYTDDPYTRLKSGDMGTITYVDALPEVMGGEKKGQNMVVRLEQYMIIKISSVTTSYILG